MLTKQSQVHVKRNNLQLVLDTIIKHEPLSRADIVRHTHISKPAVSSLTDDLLQRGIVGEIGEGLSSGGRKPILLRFNSERRHLFAFEMGRAGYRAAISDLKGNFVREREGVFLPGSSIEQRLKVLRDNLLEMFDDGIGIKDLLKIICIAPGIYVQKGEALKWTPNYQEAEGQELSEYFRGIFGREIMIYHSTKLALLGEKIAGEAKGYKDVVYIDFAYGLGCALMIDGNIHFGVKGCAGEIGYAYSTPQEFRDSAIKPYQFGCLERWVSGKALQERGAAAARNKAGKIAELAGGKSAQVTGKTVFDAYRLGDPAARKIIGEAFDYLNQALCNMINLLAPECVILGGGFSRAGDVLIDLISGAVKDRVLMMPRLVVSGLKNEASLIGGIHYLIKNTDFLTEL